MLEMDALWRVWGMHLDDIQAGIIQAADNNFFDFADAQSIGKLEKFLDISYDGPRSLVERRNVVKAYVAGSGHIGQKEIKDMISAFTDGDIALSLVGGAIHITVTRDYGDRFNLYDCHIVLDKRIPAHLALSVIDRCLPVSLVNEERLVFRNFKARFALSVRKVIVTGPILDGEYILDGAWPLDSLILFQGLVYAGFAAKSRLKNTGGAAAKQLHMAGYGARSNSALSGFLTKTADWTLDGAYMLDGSNELQKIKTKEDFDMANSVFTLHRREKICKVTSGAIPSIAPIAKMAFGNGGADSSGNPIPPLETATALGNELARYNIEPVTYPVSTTARYTATIPENDLNGAEISEVALIDGDNVVCAIQTMFVKRKDVGVTFTFTFDDEF